MPGTGKARRGIFLAVAVVMALLSGGCASSRLSESRQALADGRFYKAEALLRREYNKADSRKDRQKKAGLALDLGEALLNMGMYGKAATALANARRLGADDPRLDLMLDFARADGAFGDSLLQTRIKVKPATHLNSRRSEHTPAFTGQDRNTVIFTSTSDKAAGTEVSQATGMKNGDLFRVVRDANGLWSRPLPLDGPVNTPDDEGTPSLTADGRTLYFSRASRQRGNGPAVGIYVSRRNQAAWSEPEAVAIPDTFPTATGHPAVSPDGRWLYFSSNRPGGYGGLDIWRVNTSDPGHPVNLGPRVNTPGNESFPYVENDSTLWFSSDTHPGFGGMDLFVATVNGNGGVTGIRNAGQPLNSRGDDFGIAFADGSSGLFSTNRFQADGHDNIWEFTLPAVRVSVAGTVTDRDEEPLPGALLRLVGEDGLNLVTLAGQDGSYEFMVNPGVRYVMRAGREGFLNQKQEFATDPGEEDAVYESDFRLAAIGQPVVLENIFYDFDKATLRPESKQELDSLADVLRDHPYLTISLEAHTDRKGSEDYNKDLSFRRAKAVESYLVGAGIDARRLKAEGFGKSSPKTVTRRIHRLYPQFETGIVLTPEFIMGLEEEDREAADQINRRTEFRITSTDFE